MHNEDKETSKQKVTYLDSLLTASYLFNVTKSHLNLVLIGVDLGQLMVDHQSQIIQAAVHSQMCGCGYGWREKMAINGRAAAYTAYGKFVKTCLCNNCH